MTCHIHARSHLLVAQKNEDWRLFQESFSRNVDRSTDIVKRFLDLCTVTFVDSPAIELISSKIKESSGSLKELAPLKGRMHDLFKGSSFFTLEQKREITLYLTSKKSEKARATIEKVVAGKLLDIREKDSDAKKQFEESVNAFYLSSDRSALKESLNNFYSAGSWGRPGPLYDFLSFCCKRDCDPIGFERILINLIDCDDSVKIIHLFVSTLQKEDNQDLLNHFKDCGRLLGTLAPLYSKWGRVHLKRTNADIFLRRSIYPVSCKPLLTPELVNAFLGEKSSSQ